jgi:hypothetical protein
MQHRVADDSEMADGGGPVAQRPSLGPRRRGERAGERAELGD